MKSRGCNKWRSGQAEWFGNAYRQSFKSRTEWKQEAGKVKERRGRLRGAGGGRVRVERGIDTDNRQPTLPTNRRLRGSEPKYLTHSLLLIPPQLRDFSSPLTEENVRTWSELFELAIIRGKVWHES